MEALGVNQRLCLELDVLFPMFHPGYVLVDQNHIALTNCWQTMLALKDFEDFALAVFTPTLCTWI
jgi:hypothetical protein